MQDILIDELEARVLPPHFFTWAAANRAELNAAFASEARELELVDYDYTSFAIEVFCELDSPRA
jgi:hypothetical protein